MLSHLEKLGDIFKMKAALVTPFLNHIPLYPSTYLAYGTAILKEKLELSVFDLNARIYNRNKTRLKDVLLKLDENQVVFDDLDLYPFYLELLETIEWEYSRIPWQDYQIVFVTMPSWFVTLPTETVLNLSAIIQKRSPNTEIVFFGNSLGTWTDQDILKANQITVRHINTLFEPNSSAVPVCYDTLPTPLYPRTDEYIFNIIPFKLKHGCSWGKCRFCSLARGWNTGYLERSPRVVISELEKLIDKYDPDMFICTDNTLNGHNLLKFCRYFKRLEKPWGGMARADLTKREINCLRETGCRLIYFGLESGSDSVLNEMNKGIDTRQLSDFIKNLHAVGIFSAPSVIVGLPGETDKDFKKTLRFIADHADYIDTLNIFPFMLTPGSEFSEHAKRPNTQTSIRLFELIKAASNAGLKVCVGEQTDEYVILSKVYQGDRSY